MGRVEVDDDVFGDDPTVTRLEELAADLLGKEAGMFVPSGTQSNLCAHLTHCGRADEYIVGQTAHTYLLEGGGTAALGGIQPQPIDQAADGTLSLEKIAVDFDSVSMCLSKGLGAPAGSVLVSSKEVCQRGETLAQDGGRWNGRRSRSTRSWRKFG